METARIPQPILVSDEILVLIRDVTLWPTN